MDSLTHVNTVVGNKLCLVRLVQDQRQKQEAQPGRICNAMITEVHCDGLSKHRQQACFICTLSLELNTQARTGSELTILLLIASTALPTFYYWN